MMRVEFMKPKVAAQTKEPPTTPTFFSMQLHSLIDGHVNTTTRPTNYMAVFITPPDLNNATVGKLFILPRYTCLQQQQQ